MASESWAIDSEPIFDFLLTNGTPFKYLVKISFAYSLKHCKKDAR